MLTVYNLNDLRISTEKPSLIEKIAQELQGYYSKYVNWSFSEWKSLVENRLNTKTNGIPATLVILDEINGSKKFVGTISVERGCEEINDTKGTWINGLFTEDSYRNQGVALLLLKNLLEYFIHIQIFTFSLYALDNPRLDDFYQNIGVHEIEKRSVEITYNTYPIIIRNGNTKQVLDNVNERLKQTKYNSLEKISIEYTSSIFKNSNITFFVDKLNSSPQLQLEQQNLIYL